MELLSFFGGCVGGRFIWFPKLKFYGISLAVRKFHENSGLSSFTVVYNSVAKSLKIISRTLSMV